MHVFQSLVFVHVSLLSLLNFLCICKAAVRLQTLLYIW